MPSQPTGVQRTGTTWTATINSHGYPTSFTNMIHAVGDDGRTYCDRYPDIDPSDDVLYPQPQLSRGDNHLCVDCVAGRPASRLSWLSGGADTPPPPTGGRPRR